MEVYNSKYLVCFYDEKTNILTSTWLVTTEWMNANNFKEEMLKFPELINKYSAKYLLAVLNDLRFPIEPELQIWVVKNIAPKYVEAKLKKQAIVVPSDFITELSMEQIVDDVDAGMYEYKPAFFKDIESAKAWLCK